MKAKDLSSQVATGQTPWASSRKEQAVGAKLQGNGIDEDSLVSPSQEAQWGYRDGSGEEYLLFLQRKMVQFPTATSVDGNYLYL